MREQSGLIRNSINVFLHDVKSLFHAPAALIVAFALLVLPSLYAWYNVVGFWNPYEHTGNLRVCVVNEDAGGSNDLVGELNIGDMIVDKLKDNDQLKWEFDDKQAADDLINSGEAYAAFAIPSDFTDKLLAMIEGSYEPPTVTYITNEKAGPVSPKITDVGATTLDETINSAFVSTVSETAVEAIDKALGDETGTVKKAKALAIRRINEAHSKVTDAVKKLDASSKSIDSAISKASDSLTKVSGLKGSLSTASKEAESLATDLTKLQKQLSDFSDKSWPLASSAISSISKASTKAANAASSITSQVSQASALVNGAAAQAQVALDQAKSASGDLRSTANSLPDSNSAKSRLVSLCNRIDERCASIQSAIKDIQGSSSSIASSQEKVSAAASDNDKAIQALTTAMQGATSSFFSKTAPSINTGISKISSAISLINASVPAQEALLGELEVILGEVKAALENSKTAIDSTKDMVNDFDTDLKDLKTSAASILSSGAIANLIGEDGLDASKIAEFMGSPTEVKTEKLFSPNVYGAAMAPLFMNLTFWIGAFMLIVIIRQEVNYPQIKRLSAAQQYLGRFWLFACMAILQAVICCLGILAIGVETASAVALVFAACVTSLAYLSIIYMLSLTLQYVGKGICVLLIFAQIPGATGLYPVEMTSGFFQAIYPIFPFTYGIEAMRESICGFYGMAYGKDLLVLLLYFAIAMVLGLAVRPYMANVSRTVSLQVHKSGVYNGEKTTIPPRPFWSSQIIRLLSDRDGFGKRLKLRYERFAQWYPRIIRASIIFGIAVPLVLVAVFALTPTAKVVIITIWLVFLLALFIMLVIVESLKNSLNRQLRLEGVAGDQVIGLFNQRGADGKPFEGSEVKKDE